MFELFLLIFFFIIFKNESSELNINEFVIKYSVFALALLRLIPSFAKLSSYFSVILYNLKSIDFIRNDLKKNSKLDLKKSFRTIRANNIQLSNIYLNYINKKGTKISSKFKNLNLNFSKDNIYGIYGASGSGKTSILNLISGFIKPSKGKVLFNNKEYSLLAYNLLWFLYSV